MPAALPPEAILSSDDVLGTAGWHNLLLAINGGPLRHEHVAVLARDYHRVAAHSPAGAVGLFVVSPDSTPTPADVRRQLGEMLKRLGPSLRHVAVVLTGSTVWVLVCRTLLRGVSVIWGQPGGFSVHASVEDACRELLPLLREPMRLGVACSEVGEIVRALAVQLASGAPGGERSR